MFMWHFTEKSGYPKHMTTFENAKLQNLNDLEALQIKHIHCNVWMQDFVEE